MTTKFVVRPVREEDYDAFLELAVTTGGELTNLPGDPEVVRFRMDESLHSFDPKVQKAGSHRYLFLLEKSGGGPVAGTCGIISKVGGFQPWYSYELRVDRAAYAPAGIDHEVRILSPIRNYNGPSEICSLFLKPEYRKGGLGRLLSLSRFHFMAEFSRRFDLHVIAELRGITKTDRRSPFWEGVGRHFFQMDFQRADSLSGLEDKEFIESLMPKYPIYVALIGEKAREVIGRAHPDAEPALRLLQGEGFRHRGQVDIFDAGPIVEAELGEVRTVLERRNLPVSRIIDELPGEEGFLISNNRLEFRACMGHVDTSKSEEVGIDRATAIALEIEEGETISFSPLRAAALSLGSSCGDEATVRKGGEGV